MCKMCGLELTEQERKILEQRIRYSKKQSVIAKELEITERTVINHFNIIYHKIGVGGSETPQDKKQLAAQTYYWWHALRDEGLLGGKWTAAAAGTVIEDSTPSETDIRVEDSAIPQNEDLLAVESTAHSKIPKQWAIYLLVFIVISFVIGGFAWYWRSRSPEPIAIQPQYFVIQPSEGNVNDEFLLDLRYVPLAGLQKIPGSQGVDLRKYSLEIRFTGGEGGKVQFWYKNSDWASVYSHEYIITTQAICYDPFRDGRDRDEFNDFSNIYAVGAKLASGTEGVQIVSANLVPQCTQNKGE